MTNTEQIVLEWVILYLIGTVLAWGVIMRLAKSGPSHKVIDNPEDGFKKFPTLWYVDFEEQWSGHLRERRVTYRKVFLISLLSWLPALLYSNEPGKLQWKLDPLPDKESFRLVVESQRLMDPEWMNSDTGKIRDILNERKQAKDN